MACELISPPVGATHTGGGNSYYRHDGHVWKFWSIPRKEWLRCTDNIPVHNPVPLPVDFVCCGNVCEDPAMVKRYIKQLEAVAEAARLVAYGALAGDIKGDVLRQKLSEVVK